LQTQFQNLRSRSLIERVMKMLDLDKDEFYRKKADPIQAVINTITISPVRLSRLVDIFVEHPEPHKAQLIADTLASEFIHRNADQKKLRLSGALEFLREESGRLATNVTTAEQELMKYRLDHKMSSLAEDQNTVVQSFRNAQLNYETSLNAALTDGKVAREVHAAIERGDRPRAIPQVLNQPAMVALSKELTDREAKLFALQGTYGPKYPVIDQLTKEIEDYRRQIEAAAKEQVNALDLASAQATARFQVASNWLETSQKKLDEFNELRINYEVLNRKLERSKDMYAWVIKNAQETQLSQNDTTQNIRVEVPAFVKPSPVKPRKLLTLVLGVVGGLAVGVGLAFFVNYLDDSIKTQDDVEAYLRLPFLGYVPNIKTNSVIERDLQSHTQPQSNAAEGFRTVRAAISLAPRADKQRIIAVTSTIPSEGKSLVASNLAIVIAQTGLKTCLVDADLRRPSVHKAYELQSPVGLSSYLQEKAQSIEELVHDTEVPNLDVICCGAVPQNPSELVGSRRMGQFLNELRNRYDRVILDCPPVSAVSDPLVIASMSDGVVFVTKFNKIRREHARKSVQRIQDAGVRITGVVLNDIDFEGKDSYYYSYYYYQNRYYASYKTEKPERKTEDTAKKS
ncbi:MAG TPA: polysaccharide biosynthesis tyrosine autokinase, partial [Verrucomicrobiae bacterium]|nr:polysaccharide biosynthesis tyrosine autokinase [Verrucomicrobiae bacterium]